MQLPDDPADLYEIQRIALDAGYQKVVGVDEAGRGPLAGPVTAAAVCLPPDISLPGLNDSKQVNERARDELYEAICSDSAISWAVVSVDSQRIDRINILQATHEAMRQAVNELPIKADIVFVDGNPVSDFCCPAINIVKGDAKCAAISAASILAKVHRDRLMQEYDGVYPGYGFGIHKGYGTRQHLDALRELGPCEIHRCSFSPVARIINDERQGKLDLFG